MSTRIGRFQIYERGEVRSRWTAASAEVFVRRFLGDALALRTLREMVAATLSTGAHGTDADVLARVAKMLVSGDLVLTEPKTKAPPAGQLGVRTPVVQEVRRMMKAAPVLAEESPTFGGNLHAALQAASLMQASDAGVPFCEVCERMRKRGAA